MRTLICTANAGVVAARRGGRRRSPYLRFTLPSHTMKPPNPTSVVFTLSALWILWSFGFQTLWVRYPTELEGVVVYSHHTSRTPRYGTEYVIRDASGHDTHYVAGATDASLDRSIPVGSRIEKKWGQLGYALDGEWQSFPVVFYEAAMGLAVFLLYRAALVQCRPNG